jgi:serine/threonine protein phosphatase 1
MKIKSKMFAIGDIHGCYIELIELIGQMNIGEDDNIIFLGDYIDRGLQSLEVIKFLISFKQQYRNAIFLKGNHEGMLLNALQGIGVEDFLYNGGIQTLKSFGIKNIDDFFPDKKQMRLLKFFDDLKLYYETENFIFVHAGIKPNNLSIDKQPESILTWIRDEFLNAKSFYTNKIIVHGHTPFSIPRIHFNKIGIDTCCFKSHILTGIELPYGDDTTKEEIIFYNTLKKGEAI